MKSKAIKLYDGSTYLLPVTLASLVQYSAGSSKISVQSAIESVVSAELSNGHNSIITTTSSGTSTAAVTSGNYAYLNTLTRQGDAITSSIGIKGGGDISITYSSTNGLVISSNVSSLGRVVDAYLAVVDGATSTTPLVAQNEIEYTTGIPLSTLNVVKFGENTTVSGHDFYLKCGDNIKYSYRTNQGLKITASDSKVKQSSNTNNEKHYLLSKYTGNSSTEETTYTVFNTYAYINPAAAYLYAKYAYATEIKENNKTLAEKYSSKSHTHSFEFLPEDVVGVWEPQQNTVNVLGYILGAGVEYVTLSENNTATITYQTVSVPTKKYIDDNFVTQSAFETFSASGMHYMGSTGTETTFNPSSPTSGDVYIVGVAGHGITGTEVGDFIVYNGTSWDIWDKNVTGAMYHGTTTLTSGQVVLTDGTDGKVRSVAAPSVSIISNANITGATFPVAIKHIFNNLSTNLPFLGYNGGVVTIGTSAQGHSYIGISYTPDHVGSGTTGHLTYWKSGTEHASLNSSYGSNTTDSVQLHYIDSGILKNVSVGSGSSSIPTYVDSSGKIKPVTSIDSSLLASSTNTAMFKLGTNNGNTHYAYIGPHGTTADTTNSVGNTFQIVQGSNVTLTSDTTNNKLTIASSYTNDAKLVLNGDSTNSADTAKDGTTTTATTNVVYMHSYTTTQTGTDKPIKIVGEKGVQIYSNGGKELRVTHNFDTSTVISSATLTKLTYFVSSSTVDDFTLTIEWNDRPNNVASLSTNTVTSYIMGIR